MSRSWVVVLTAGLLVVTVAGCDSSSGASGSGPSERSAGESMRPLANASTTIATPSTLAPTTTVAIPAFSSTTSTVTAADLPSTSRSGCPVGPSDLRMLRMSYWGFDNLPHTGTMVIHADVVSDVIKVFNSLY